MTRGYHHLSSDMLEV